MLLWLVPAAARSLGFEFDPIRALLTDVAEPVLRFLIQLAGNPIYGVALVNGTDG